MELSYQAPVFWCARVREFYAHILNAIRERYMLGQPIVPFTSNFCFVQNLNNKSGPRVWFV